MLCKSSANPVGFSRAALPVELRSRIPITSRCQNRGCLPCSAALRRGALNVPNRWQTERRPTKLMVATPAVSSVATSLIASGDTWSIWSALLCAAAFGLWSERTQWGAALSGPLVSTLAALALSNLGVLPTSAAAYSVVNSYLLPLAVPLLLFAADLQRVVRETGRLLCAFCLGALGTVLGTFVALFAFPMLGLGEDAWKVAAALCSRHIGGAVNYVAVAEYLNISPSVVAAGLAADNLCCAIYFATIFWLAGPAVSTLQGAVGVAAPVLADAAADAGSMEDRRGSISVTQASFALALAAVLCACSVAAARALGIAGADIPIITLVVVALATAFPKQVGALAPAAEGLAAIILQVFFAVVGAAGSVRAMVATAPSLFFFSVVQVAVALGFILVTGKASGYTLPEVLLASNANIGGPTTAAGMANAKGWRALLVPAILMGILGYALATFLSIALGEAVLAPLWRSGLLRPPAL